MSTRTIEWKKFQEIANTEDPVAAGMNSSKPRSAIWVINSTRNRKNPVSYEFSSIKSLIRNKIHNKATQNKYIRELVKKAKNNKFNTGSTFRNFGINNNSHITLGNVQLQTDGDDIKLPYTLVLFNHKGQLHHMSTKDFFLKLAISSDPKNFNIVHRYIINTAPRLPFNNPMTRGMVRLMNVRQRTIIGKSKKSKVRVTPVTTRTSPVRPATTRTSPGSRPATTRRTRNHPNSYAVRIRGSPPPSPTIRGCLPGLPCLFKRRSPGSRPATTRRTRNHPNSYAVRIRGSPPPSPIKRCLSGLSCLFKRRSRSVVPNNGYRSYSEMRRAIG